MNFRTTYILFGLLAGVLVLFGVALYVGPSTDTDDYILPSLHRGEKVKQDDIVSVEIERKRPKPEKIVATLDQDTETWKLTEPIATRLDRFTGGQLVGNFFNARKSEKAEVNNNLKEWGLDNPATVATIKHKDGREWKISLGNESAGKDDRLVYVSSSDRPSEVIGVKASQLGELFKAVNELRSKDLLADFAGDIKSVNLRDGKHDPVYLEEEGDKRWRFRQPDYGAADFEGPGATATTKPPSGVNGLLEAVAGLKVDYKADGPNDFVADTVSVGDLAKYGLEDGGKDQIRIEAKRSVGGKFGSDKTKTTTDVLVIGKETDDKGDKKRYARLESERNVVKVSAKGLEAIQNILDNPSALRNRNLVDIDANLKLPDVVYIKDAGGQTIKLYRPDNGSEWKMFREGSAPQKADIPAVESLVRAIAEKRLVKDFAPAGTSEGAASTVISLWVDGIEPEKKEEKKPEADDKKDTKSTEKKEEKKEAKKDPNAEPKLRTDKPTYRLTFGKEDRDKSVVYVKRETDKDSTVVMVPTTVLDRVKQGPLAYMDKTLPTFDGDPTKLVLNRGAETVELVREKKDDKTTWKIVQPKDLEGRAANTFVVDGIIADLKNLRADKLIEEKADAATEKKYGLDAPKLKATLTVEKDGNKEDRVYSFGADAGTDSVYGKQSGSPLLYAVQKFVLNAMQGEYRDTMVFSLEPSKVKGLKLRGWHDHTPSGYTLELERKGSRDWTVKSSSTPNYNLDPNKAEDVLNNLLSLRAEQFVSPRTTAKPEHKLSVADGAMEIDIIVDGEKEPVTVIVGGPAPENRGYYATSNKAPGDVFVVGKFRFENLKDHVKDVDKSGTPFYLFKKQ
jgi:hypothetical protein